MTLRRRLLAAILLAAALPALLVGAVHLATIARTLEEHIDAQALRATEDAARDIDALLQEAARSLHALAATGVLQKAPAEAIPSRIRSWSYAHPYFRDVLWVDPRGTVVASVSGQEGRQIGALHADLDEAFSRALREPAGPIHVADFDGDAAKRRGSAAQERITPPALTLHLLLRVDDARGAPQGVLVAVLVNDAIEVTLADLKRRLRGARSVELLNLRGEVLMSSEGGMVALAPHPFAQDILGAVATGAKWFESRSNGTHLDVELARTTGIGPSRSASWLIAATRLKWADRVEMLQAAAAGLLVLAATLAVAALFAIRFGRAIVRPVEALAAAAQRLGEGDLDARVPATGTDEIGTLAQTFNRMADDLRQDRGRTARLNAELNSHVAQLTAQADEIDARRREAQGLAELGNVLQLAASLEEAARVLPPLLVRLLEPHAGAVYVMDAARGDLTRLAAFGEGGASAEAIAPAECWALRRGIPYAVGDAARDVLCAHVAQAAAPAGYLCVPMQSPDGAPGLLHVVFGAGAEAADALRARAERIAAQIAVGLANLKLRETLARTNASLEARVRERRLAEQALALNEERLRLALTGAHLGTWHWNIHTGESAVSDQFLAIFGIPPGTQVSYEDFLAAVHPEDRARIEDAVQRAVKERTDFDTEYRVLWPDGSIRWVAGKGRAYCDEAGQPVRMEGLVQDITERTQAEEALRRSEFELRQLNATLERRIAERTAELERTADSLRESLRVKGEFMASVTHELRTPLNSIIGFAEMLEARVPGPLNDEQAAFAADILASGRQLLAIVSGILQLTRLDAGGEGARAERVDLAQALEEAADAHRGAAAARRVSIAVETAHGAGSAQLDPRALRQALDHLLSNAVKFNRDGGSITLRAAREDGRIEIAVVDTGIGIARGDLPKLFRPFVQLDAALARRYGGLGLGLALVRRLAEAMGGEAGAESEPGQGSRFWLRLPGEGQTSVSSSTVRGLQVAGIEGENRAANQS